MPFQQTSGNSTQDAYGGGVAVEPVYIESVFSTWLYTGTGGALTITNGVDLSTKGGLVWAKRRDTGTTPPANANAHILFDTSRGQNVISTNTTDAQYDQSAGFTPLTTGFSLSTSASSAPNATGASLVSWTFRKQPKFFDIVTYTGTGSNATISHNLGSEPGCIIVKRTDTTADWAVYHRGIGATQGLNLNTTSGDFSAPGYWNDASPTSTVINLGNGSQTNASGGSYVAYLFAHNAGGFGLTGTDNVISCGSYVGNGMTAGPQVTLGYEPQWVLRKNATAARGGPGTAGSWSLVDNMRGLSQTTCPFLFANESAAEDTSTVTTGYIIPNATGFVDTYTYPGDTYIYIAIRRGPMKVPTLGTSVFSPNYQNVSTGTAITTNFPPDLQLYRSTAQSANEGVVVDRLRGVNTTTTANSTPWLDTTTTAAEATASSVTRNWGNTGFEMPGFVATIPSVFYSYRRAPSFFDEVCYSGTGAVGNAVSHNLGVAPELMIIKGRAGTVGANDWQTLANISSSGYIKLFLNKTDAALGPYNYTINAGLAAQPTSTNFTVNNVANFNNGSTTYVAYLFATCPGVSKVGTYTGNGTTQTINCGFGAGGARFVLIKQTDTTGGWYVYDTARGMTVLTDPYLFLNSTAAETATLGSVTTVSTGFALNSAILADINVSAGTYIFLAIA